MPCARVSGRYAELRNVKNRGCTPVELGPWLINERGLNVVANGREPSESLAVRLDYGIGASGKWHTIPAGTTLWPRSCSINRGTIRAPSPVVKEQAM